MGFSLSSIGSSIGNAVNSAASTVGKTVGDLLGGGAKPAETPAKPVDSFEAAPTKAPSCGGNTTEGAQCLPSSWGKNSGGGGGKAGVDPG